MTSSSSSPSFAQASSSGSWKYDVFLSFRGEDTRNTFVGHLYSALEQQGIHTYKDDETLPRGESIRLSLLKAIEESQIAVVVLSKNYGDSSWCLDELAHIMQCKDSRGQTVMPIFYEVDPSEVRKQNDIYEEAFAKHELENKSKVESWRKALVDASNISGWEPSKVANGDESKCIKKIVVEISQKLHLVTPTEKENLIGMAARIQHLKSELKIEAGGVRMVGIWGVGGGGKTTLASSLYDEICRQFDGSCFIQNVQEESSRHGLGKLEEDILSKLGVNRVGGGRSLISNRLCHRKVLIVLDDVDHLDQLKVLAGSHDWFGEGSRLIITTRDKHLLTAHKVNVIHNIRLLNSDEAIKLFCIHAPRENCPVEDYEQLSKDVVSYASGLPLALTVLGSFLCDKDINEWKSALVRLKEIPDTDIVEKLKISFDGLTKDEKDLFLDIACFYRGEDKNMAMGRLNACGFHPVIGVKVLIQKALIIISDGRFDMHDLVQETGHHIVRGEHLDSPEKHSRLWKEEDVLKICAMDVTEELDMIEAVKIQYNNRVGRLPQIVANMKNLRLIDWEGDTASPLPTNFSPRKLCYLRLAWCSLKHLWEGYKLLPNLKIMELWCLENLIRTPQFNGLPNLERLRVGFCILLEEIHPSIERLEKLISLTIEDCESIKAFPPGTALKKLETISFARCIKLFIMLDNSRDEVASDTESSPIFFVDCWRCSCNNLPGVECHLEGPSSPNNMNHLWLRSFLNDLRDLDLSECSLGDEEMISAVWDLPNLITLNLSGNKFSRLDFSLLRLPRLKQLNVSDCYELEKLSALPSSIAVVLADWCKSLETFGDISNCKWLWKVSLWANEKNKVDGDILLDSMLQGNVGEDYFISIILTHQIPKRFEGRLFRGRTFTLVLPDDWYNDFCGFLICVVTDIISPNVDILIKQEVDEDSLIELLQESFEAVEPEYDCSRKTCVGYVSFGSLTRHTTFSNSSSCTLISVEVKDWYLMISVKNYIGVELVPRKSKGHQPQTTTVATDSSEYWDQEFNFRAAPSTTKHESKSSIAINCRF